MSEAAPHIDLRPDHWAIVRGVLRQHVPDRKVVAFGSRATWSAKDYSDLDLAIMGDEPLSLDVISALAERLGESDLPFKVDLVDWARIDERFRDIIRRDGVEVPVSSNAIETTWRLSLASGSSAAAATQLGFHTEIVMGQSPPGDTCSMSSGGVPLLNGPTEFGSHHPDPVQFTTHARKMAYPGDLLFCVRGSTTGRMNWADQEYAIGRGVAAIRHKQGDLYQPFVRAVVEFNLPDLLLQATGSTFPNVSAQQLAKLWWPPLDLPEQRTIAHILGTLDDKIELNRRMNETLQAMVRSIFKDWFVDFGPVWAKMEGRDSGLPQEIAHLFPNRFVASELGEIPEGWRAGSLGDVANLNSETWSVHNRPKKLAYVDLANTKWGYVQCVKAYSWHDAPSRARRVLRKGDTIVATVRPGNGSFALISEGGLTGSTGFAVLRPRTAFNRAFVWCAATSSATLERLANLADGGAYPAVRPDTVTSTPVVLPDICIRDAFIRVADPLLDKIETSKREAGFLVALRDAVLPKLICGQLQIEPKSAELLETA